MNEDIIPRFEAYMNGLGHTDETRRLRRYLAARFLRDHDLATVSLAGVVAFMGNPGWKPTSRAAARAALRLLFKWAVLEGIRPDNPMADFPPIRTFMPPPRPAPESALADALARVEDPRTRVILLLGAYAGLRRAEIARLHSDAIQENGTLRVLGKGGKTRVIPVHPLLVEPLAELKARGGWLFPSPYGDKPCNPRLVNRLLRGVLPPGFSTHTLRHRFATQVHSRSKDLRAVQVLLGHSSLATTQRYVGVSDEELADAVATLID
jgi:integrase/recombinase XerC